MRYTKLCYWQINIPNILRRSNAIRVYVIFQASQNLTRLCQARYVDSNRKNFERRRGTPFLKNSMWQWAMQQSYKYFSKRHEIASCSWSNLNESEVVRSRYQIVRVGVRSTHHVPSIDTTAEIIYICRRTSYTFAYRQLFTNSTNI